MFAIKIADIPIAVDVHYSYMEQLCKDYRVEIAPEECAFAVSATHEEIAAENDDANAFSPAYCESLALYRKMCTQLLNYDACLFHAAIIAYEGRGYAFTAKSGTGKSTHISQWTKALGEKVSIVNGDKPVIRFQDGGFVAYGTPFNGKERWGTNTSIPLAAICFVERDEHDTLSRATDEGDIIGRMVQQILVPKEPLLAVKQLDILDKLVTHVPFYLLRCTPTRAAFEAAFQMTLCNNE